MLEKIIKDYFSFSKKERIAVITLVILVMGISLLPYLIPEPELSELDKSRLQFDSSRPLKEGPGIQAYKTNEYRNVLDNTRSYERRSSVKNDLALHSELFFFDPNTLPVEGWKKLGLRDRTIITIQNYLSKGAKFKKGNDLEKIYGLHKDEADRLIPYVRIVGIQPPLKKERSVTDARAAYRSRYSLTRGPTAVYALTDINTADSFGLEALPGIGNKLAGRILHFREKLGGFYSIDQLSEIYGLPDSTFQKIRPLLTLGNVAVSFINLNTAPKEDLQKHPYFKGGLASAIVEYRRQHGEYKSLEEIRKIALITQEVYSKIAPYCKVE